MSKQLIHLPGKIHASQIEDFNNAFKLSNNYETSSENNNNLLLEAGDTYEEAFGKLEKEIFNNSEITAAAIQQIASAQANAVTSVNGETGDVEIPIYEEKILTAEHNDYDPGKYSFYINGKSPDNNQEVINLLVQNKVVIINGTFYYLLDIKEDNVNNRQIYYVGSINHNNSELNIIGLRYLLSSNSFDYSQYKTINLGGGGVTSVNGMTGAVTITHPVTSVNGMTGTVVTQLSDDYEASSLENEYLEPEVGDTYEEAISKLHKAILDNELIIAEGMNDLNDQIANITHPVTSVNGQTGAVTVNVPVASVNGMTGAVVISGATTSNAGLMSSTDKSKLDGLKETVIYDFSGYTYGATTISIDGFSGICYGHDDETLGESVITDINAGKNVILQDGDGQYYYYSMKLANLFYSFSAISNENSMNILIIPYSSKESTQGYNIIFNAISMQEQLVSGANIKTINNQSLLGTGNITISNDDYEIIDVNATLRADVNKDGIITAYDYNNVTSSGTAPNNDVNNDGQMTIADTTVIVNLVLNKDTNNMLINLETNPFTNIANIISNNKIPILRLTFPGDKIYSMIIQQSYSAQHATSNTVKYFGECIFHINIPANGTNDELNNYIFRMFVSITESLATGIIGNEVTREQLLKKQDTLVSGTNIKTINNESLLGTGNITIQSDLQFYNEIPSEGIAQIEVSDDAGLIGITKYDSSKNEISTIRVSDDIILDAVNDGDIELRTYNSGKAYYNSNEIATVNNIPTAVTESTVSGWGFTKNTGKVTSVNGMTGVVTITHPVTSVDGMTGAVTITHPVTSVNGQTGTVSLSLGDTNIIETVKVNGTALTPDSNKAIDIDLTNYDKAPLVIEVNDTDTTVPSGTYANITAALAAGRDVVVKLTLTEDVDQTFNCRIIEDDSFDGNYLFGYCTGKDYATCVIDNTNNLTIELDGLSAIYASKLHTHTLTSDTTISNGDKLVITDADGGPAYEIARASISFDGSTTTKALTPKGTWETFLKTAPVTSVNGSTGAVTVKANVQSDWNATTGDAVILNKPTIPAAVTESTVSGWGFTKNAGQVTTFNGATGAVSQVKANWNETNSSSYAYIQNKPTIPTVNDSTVTITMNGNTVGTFTLNKSGNTTIDLGTVLTAHQSIKTINNQTITGTGNVSLNTLPTVSASDNGKVLMVVNGSWQLVSPVTLYSGSGTPANSQGNNGDLYVQS